MPRQPIELEMAGMLTPRERVWRAVRQLKAYPFTIELVQDSTLPLVSIDAVQGYLLELCQAGYLQKLGEQGRVGPSKFDEISFKLLKDSFEAPRVATLGRRVTQGTGTLAMWRAMKALKVFDYRDVQRAASQGTCIVSAQTAKSYVLALDRAGYFRTVREAQPGTPGRFRLVVDTGAHAPAITRRKAVFDRNLGKFTWQQPAQEGCEVVSTGLDCALFQPGTRRVESQQTFFNHGRESAT